ncbi:hypothetical protein KW791_03320 [Candidatus Parcubacteria bacterium]|nr:hypothetical protein [Candidatus Parcubacteria bacterium]
MPSLESRLAQILEKDKNFKLALNIARKVSSGKIWLVGGAVYKTLIADLQGSTHTVKDYDFIVERVAKSTPKIRGFQSLKTSFGSPRFKSGGLSLDVVPLGNIIAVKEWGYKPSIQSYLKQVPLSVQSVAYHIDSGRLHGAGAKDIKEGTIRIHNKKWQPECVIRFGEKYDLDFAAKKLNLKPVK